MNRLRILIRRSKTPNTREDVDSTLFHVHAAHPCSKLINLQLVLAGICKKSGDWFVFGIFVKHLKFVIINEILKTRLDLPKKLRLDLSS